MKTDALITHLSRFHPRGYDLSLGRIRSLLGKFNNPQDELPPVFHVAGTNGKGSAIANLRHILEASGNAVHSHTSPHLVNYHERFRLAQAAPMPQNTSRYADDEILAEALSRVAKQNGENQITIFELLIATMFLLFKEHVADYAIVEVGLGGRFDATNVIAKPLASIITSISLDHQSHLGDTVEKIAFEKAGIIKPGCPVILAPQEDSVRQVLEDIAEERKAPIMIGGQDFDFYEQGGKFIYQDTNGLLDLPLPKLAGEHQLANSATAIAALRFCNICIEDSAYEIAMTKLHWPGRMEKLRPGKLANLLPDNTQVWIDGGHNEAAARAISTELDALLATTSNPPILICAMLNSKDPKTYLEQFKQLNPAILSVPIISSPHGIDQAELAKTANDLGFASQSFDNLTKSLETASQIITSDHNPNQPSIILACGSLYLVGEILKENGTIPH